MYALPATEFAPSIEVLDAATGAKNSERHTPTTPAAGGVFSAADGHHVCWRAHGRVLELCETATLPGASVHGGELGLRFADPVVAGVGVALLADGSLLVSAATSGEGRGTHVHQLRFEAPPPTQGAARVSWFAMPNVERYATADAVAPGLEAVHVARFGAPLVTHGRLRQLVLLGGAGAGGDGAALLGLETDPASGTAAPIAATEVQVRRPPARSSLLPRLPACSAAPFVPPPSRSSPSTAASAGCSAASARRSGSRSRPPTRPSPPSPSSPTAATRRRSAARATPPPSSSMRTGCCSYGSCAPPTAAPAAPPSSPSTRATLSTRRTARRSPPPAPPCSP